MAENWLRQGLDVLRRNVRPAAENGPGLAAENQELHRAGAGSPADHVLDEIGSSCRANAGLADKREGVADDVVADGDFADDPLELDDLAG